jgi:hypothetical protein
MSPSDPIGSIAFSPWARIEVTADNPAIEIRLLDSDLEVQAQGVGELKQDVPAGLYELEYSAGPSTRSELIALRAGDRQVRIAHVDFPAAAPISVASNVSESQRAELQAVAERLPAEPPGEGTGELVVFLREVNSGTDGIAPDAFVPLGLVDEHEQFVSQFDSEQEVRRDEMGRQWAAACRKLRPGTYALRVEPGSRAPTDPARLPRRAFNQSVYIEDGWQTILFVPNVARGPMPQIASIHMTRTDERWNPSSPATLALETMLACLRDGKGAISARQLELVTSEKTTNPMLAVVSAHSALLVDPPEFGLFDRIVSYLTATWPDFPDVRALYPIGEDRRRYYDRRERQGRGEPYQEPPPPTPPTRPVTWPPMLLASYQGLIACDAKWPDLQLIGENSLAERAATRLLIGGLWSAWEPFRETETDSRLRKREREEQPTGLGLGDTVEHIITGALRFLQQSVTARDWRAAIPGLTTDDPVTIRLKQFLTMMAERSDAETVQEFVAGLDVQTISQATGLPAGAIRPTLKRVQALFPKTD